MVEHMLEVLVRALEEAPYSGATSPPSRMPKVPTKRTLGKAQSQNMDFSSRRKVVVTVVSVRTSDISAIKLHTFLPSQEPT